MTTCPFDQRPADVSNILSRLKTLTSAEEFFAALNVRYDADKLATARLHILKRLFEYLRRESDLDALDEATLYARYRSLLQRAYRDFVISTPATEKVFKVHRDARAAAVPLASLRNTLPSARGE